MDKSHVLAISGLQAMLVRQSPVPKRCYPVNEHSRSAMDIQISDLTIDPSGRLLLDGLPFSPGQHVDVVIRPHEPETSPSVNLAGSVLRYDRPLDPVVDGDWESAS